jgi:hypothetical protein
MIKDANIDINAGIDPAKMAQRMLAKEYYTALSTGAMYAYLRDKGMKGAGRLFTTIATAYAKTVTGRNDAIYLSPDSHTQTAKITWARNMTHLIGQYPIARMNQRSRIGHSANYATMLDVTGYGNLFQNLYFMYGRGSATNTNLLTVTGDRNTFVNCHFGAPMHATEGDQAGFNVATILGTENYFKSCVFGITTIPWTNGDMIVFGGSGYDPRTIFDDCVFLMNADNAQVEFIKTVSGVGEAFAIFRNCQFINIGTTLTLGIDGAGTGAQKIYFDNNTFMAGVTDVVAAAYEGNVVTGSANYTAAATGNGLATTVDHTA